MGDKFLGGDERDWEGCFSYVVLVVMVFVLGFLFNSCTEFLDML
jgi:hypothetical protein